MASADQKGLERQLYGFAHPDGSIQDGLIAEASDAALFLDEVHQPETGNTSEARASLLRTLEAETYFPQDSASKRDVRNVLWIMATSKTLEELKKFKPVDFWTRMTYALEIPHPLNSNKSHVTQVPTQAIVADFFRTFWWDLCDKQYQIDPISDPNQLPLNRIPAYWQQRAMLAVIVDDNGKPLDDGKARVFASCFLKNLRTSRMRPHQFSVRGIRNMVARLFAIAWSNVAQGRHPWNAVADFEDDAVVIFREIRNVARLS